MKTEPATSQEVKAEPNKYGNRHQRRAQEAIDRKKGHKLNAFNDKQQELFAADESDDKTLVQLHPTKGFRTYGAKRLEAGIDGIRGMWFTISNSLARIQKASQRH